MKNIIFFLLLLVIDLFANTNLYNSVLVGEKDISHYYGPTFPKIGQRLDNGGLLWDEFDLASPYLDELYFEESISLERFINHELTPASICPNEYLDKNIDYIKYLYRLLTISYLYESINNYQVNLDLLRKNKSCKVNWKSFFKSSCLPKSIDMKKYISNLNRLNKFFISNVDMVGKNHQFIEKWFNDFYEEIDSTLSHTRLFSYCFTNGKNCKKFSESDITNRLNSLCQDDLNLLSSICSENDHIYGLSYVPEALELISLSNVVNVFNHNNYAKGCLARFSQMTSFKESHLDFLVDIFPTIYEQLKTNFGDSYIQGKLFIPGSFKEFEDKGLASIYEKEIKEAVEKVKQDIKPLPLKKEEIIVVENAAIKMKKSVKSVMIEKKEELKPERTKKTAFLLAVESLYGNKLSSVKVDMPKFKYDYVFTFGTLKKLNKSLKNYMSFNGLTEMKKFDQLGEKKAPIPLVFLKYMIDTNQHQGLYNIVNVIGDRFYVVNTIDKNHSYQSNYIEIRNDLSTNMKWQISVLDEPKTK